MRKLAGLSFAARAGHLPKGKMRPLGVADGRCPLAGGIFLLKGRVRFLPCVTACEPTAQGMGGYWKSGGGGKVALWRDDLPAPNRGAKGGVRQDFGEQKGAEKELSQAFFRLKGWACMRRHGAGEMGCKREVGA